MGIQTKVHFERRSKLHLSFFSYPLNSKIINRATKDDKIKSVWKWSSTILCVGEQSPIYNFHFFILSFNYSNTYCTCTIITRGLTLISMRQGTFHPLSSLDQILPAEFFIKDFQTFLELRIDINRVNLTPCQAHWV